jgi:nucleoside-diphosphate kinase
MQISRDLAAKHYAVHKARPFYAGLVEFMTSGPVVALALEGKDAIKVARNLIGATNGAEAAAGTIRGDYGVSRSFNLVHGSDGPETAAFELGLFFPEGIVAWEQHRLRWLYDPSDELGRA